MNFLSLPFTSSSRDYMVGETESGQPLMRTMAGHQYSKAYQPDDETLARLQAVEDFDRAVAGGGFPTPKNYQKDIGNPISMAWDEIADLVSMPRRAAQGEPLTYGDVGEFALEYGLMGAASPAPKGALRANGIRAYHGSPHDFDKFRMDKIGTGEGAQAYGHGLYFAESEDVARAYRDQLAKGPDTPAGNVWDLVNNYGQSPDDLRPIVEDMVRYAPDDPMRAKAEAMLRVVDDGSWRNVDPGGSMYEVNINANPDDFLDWDAPIDQSPQAFQDWAKRRMDEVDLPEGTRRQRQLANWRGADGDWQAAEGVNVPPPRVAEVRNWLGDYGEDQAQMTDALREAGIPGIKYKDAMSRGTSEGTRNYVVFDENLIEIVRKYGIAGAAAMLGVSAQEVQAQMKEQGGNEIRDYLRSK